MAVQVDYRIAPSDQFSVYNPDTKSNKTITYFTLLAKIRGDLNLSGASFEVDVTNPQDNQLIVYKSASSSWVNETVGIFKNISVSGQDTVIADSLLDTLTISAGTGVSIATDADADTITISSSAVGGTLDSTGIITGGVLTATIGGTTFNVSAGAGQIITYSAGVDSISTSLETVTWDAFTNVAVTNIASQPFTYIYIDSDGNLNQQATPFTDDQYKDYIVIGHLCHIDLSTINLVTNDQNVSYGSAHRLLELIQTFGPIKKTGLTIGSNGTNLSVNRSSGQGYVIGSNYSSDQFEPDRITLSAKTPASLCRIYRDGSGGYIFDNNSGSYYNYVDPTKYDDGTGTLNVVNNNQWTVQRLYTFPSAPDDIICYYGIQFYNSQGDALANMMYEPFSEAEITLLNSIFLGYLIVRGGAVDLSDLGDATFIQSGLFRGLGTGGGSTTNLRLEDLSDVSISSVADNQFLIYDSTSSTWQNESVGVFKTIAVSGQSDVVADSYTDTLTLVAGTNITITTDAATDTITINSPDAGGTVTNIATSAPITGGPITTTGTIGITQSGASTDGYLSSTDWNTFNGKEPALTKGNLTETTSAVLTITGGTNAVIGSGTTIQVSQATTTTSGYLSSTDWNTFNDKEPALTKGNLTETTSAILTITGGTNSVIGSGTTIEVSQATTTTSGYLSSTDWNTFNDKEPALTKGNLTETTSAILTITGGTNAVIGSGTTIAVSQASTSTSGYLSSTDWNTFNDKEPAITKGNLTETTSAILTITGGTNAVIGSGTTIAVSQASTSTSGYLSSADWNTFNDKEPAVTKGNLTEATSSVLTITGGTNAVIGSGTSIAVAQAGSTTSGYLSSTDWGTFNGKADYSFVNIAVSGQTDVVADSASDTLTLVAGTGVTITTDATGDSITIAATGSGGTVTSIATSAPLSGGPITTTGTISITQSDTSNDGYLSSTDWNTFNGKQDALTFGNLTETTSSILTITGGTGAVVGSGTTIAVTQASASTNGFLSSADWTTFNNKEPAVTKGNLTEATSAVLTITGGTGAVIGSGTSIQVSQSSASTSGYLSSTDWTTFNGKASYAFKTIAVSGQTSIVADAADDTLTVAEGARIDITTDATNDTLTVTHGTAAGADFTAAQDFKDRVEADGGTFEAVGEVAVALGILEDSLPATASDNSDGVVLQNIAVDEFGHVLGYSSTDLDDRYYTETEVDALFALETLDTVTDRGATTTNSITIGGLVVDTNTLVVDSVNNRVVIGGTTASYPLHVKTQVSNVSIYTEYDIAAYSDARVKEDVITISGALDKVISMRGVTYKRIGLDSDKRFMGVIAQEVLPHAPEVVHEDEDGMYSVSYQNMVGLLIEAMKEQQQQIEELKQQLKALSK